MASGTDAVRCGDRPASGLRWRGGDREPGWLAIMLLAVGAAAAITAVLTMVDPWFPHAGIFAGQGDMLVYRDGGWRFRHDIALYEHSSHAGLLYTYTPFSALVFVPISFLARSALEILWMTGNFMLLCVSVGLCWRMLGYRIGWKLRITSLLCGFICVFLEPVRSTLQYGQINLLLMALVLWDFSRPQAAKTAGVGTGLAAGIKLTPLFMIPVFVVAGRWRAAAVALATFLATVAVTWMIHPGDSHTYWTVKIFDGGRIGGQAEPGNQSLRGTYSHIFGAPMPGWLWLLLAGVLAVIGLAVAARLYAGGDRVLAVASSGLTSAMISPFSWNHHWVWVVPLLVYLIHRALPDWRWWGAALALFVPAGSWVYRFHSGFPGVGLFMFPPWWPCAHVYLLNIYPILYVVVELALVVAVLPRKRLQYPKGATLAGKAATTHAFR